jgi:hypothetical protein
MSEFESHEGLSRETEVLRARRESLDRLRERGLEPFALTYYVDTHAADLLAEFDGRLAPEERSDRGVAQGRSCWRDGTASSRSW